MCIVQHYISTNKTARFYDCKKCKACCNVLNIPCKDQKPTFMLFGGDGTHCFARKTSRDYGKEKPSPFLKKFLRQSQPSTSEPEPKKGWNESKYGINVSISYWLMIWAAYSFFKTFHSISIYSQPLLNLHSTYRKSWSSQSPTTESSGLSILLSTLWLLQ